MKRSTTEGEAAARHAVSPSGGALNRGFESGDPVSETTELRLDAPNHPNHLVHLPAEVFVLQPRDIQSLSRSLAIGPEPGWWPTLCHAGIRSKKRAHVRSHHRSNRDAQHESKGCSPSMADERADSGQGMYVAAATANEK